VKATQEYYGKGWHGIWGTLEKRERKGRKEQEEQRKGKKEKEDGGSTKKGVQGQIKKRRLRVHG